MDNHHFDCLLALRKKGYSLCRLKQDHLLRGVSASQLPGEDIYVLGLDYKKRKSGSSLLRKVMVFESKLHFSPILRELVGRPLGVTY